MQPEPEVAFWLIRRDIQSRQKLLLFFNQPPFPPTQHSSRQMQYLATRLGLYHPSIEPTCNNVSLIKIARPQGVPFFEGLGDLVNNPGQAPFISMENWLEASPIRPIGRAAFRRAGQA